MGVEGEQVAMDGGGVGRTSFMSARFADGARPSSPRGGQGDQNRG
jgi:hypothetical protein